MAQSLLPYFERELTQLREQGGRFAKEFPKIASRLALGGDMSSDPHVERLIESCALLSARVHKRLDDDFSLFTGGMLEVLYPHYLRPFPSCSIAQFHLGTTAQMGRGAEVPRGTVLASRPVKNVPCRFSTSQDVQLLPLTVVSAAYRSAVTAPDGTRLPQGVTSVLSLVIESQSSKTDWSALLERPLRFYLDGEPSQSSVLREVLCHRAAGVMVQTDAHGVWLPVESDAGWAMPEPVGFAPSEALLEHDARSHEAYRLLLEYFAFPDKFNFVDLPCRLPSSAVVKEGAKLGGLRRLTVHVLIRGVRADSTESHLLEAVNERNFLLGCTPVANLFEQAAEPIRVSHTVSAYPVLVDARRAYAYEVYAIDRVFRVQQGPQGESVQEFRPFFSLRHDDGLVDALDGEAGDAEIAHLGARDAAGQARMAGRYWSARRDEDVAAASPGYEVELSIVDINFDPTAPNVDTLSLRVRATNRDLPSLLPFGVPGGDLFMDGGGAAKEIRLLKKPTLTRRFEEGGGTLWRLISHLSLNHLSLSAGGIDALKEMLRLYDLPRSASNRRQIDGLVAVEFRPATAWLAGEPFASFVRGTEVRLTVDETGFVGAGLGVFATVMDHFFGLYVQANSFSKLTIVSAQTQEEVLRCPPRNGDLPLL
ncbi:type VI secretion system baseplate subunit TssF [Aquabacterium sp.]|uniref:type VI secretion system baseplate subunit TssF n=1 Tax=Aquabacterium sp. TaxID=1872578 RepID=UPI0025BED009|nr:type VI secretion system baseplate subunit TssF [Aquabacterium sp.]